MPNNNNQPDINKAIDVCMEEYKTLRTEILQTVQNRSNVIVFGGGLVLTLLGIGISPIANLPIMKETTTITRIPTNTTTIETTKGEKKTTKGETTQTTISHPKGDSSHEIKPKNSKPTSSTLVIKEKDTATETISPQKYGIPIERRIPSAIILGIMVPASCGLIIFLVNASNHQVVRIGRYIATNIEPKINDLYFNNLPVAQKPIVWETYMQTLRFGPEENNWVTVVFGGIALVANVGGIFSVVNILNNIVFSPILLVSLGIIIFIVVRLKTGNQIIQLRDGEGSLRKIWYKGINAQNKEVKSTRIFWKSNHRVWEMYKIWEMYQIVESMIDDKNIIEIENDSLKSRLQTLGEVDLANQVQNTKDSMKAQGADKQYLLNEIINDCFKNLLNKIKNYSRNPEYNPPFYFNLDKGGGKRVNNIPELLELSIDNPNKFKEYMEKGDFEHWLDNIEIRETELANIAQATREKNFPNDDERLHYFLRECCLVLIGRNP
jgi:regulator of replication initiation timing